MVNPHKLVFLPVATFGARIWCLIWAAQAGAVFSKPSSIFFSQIEHS
jgi:hypothetical protein